MLLVTVINNEINFKGETLNDEGEKNYIVVVGKSPCGQVDRL
jgi:hypothetical protein